MAVICVMLLLFSSMLDRMYCTRCATNETKIIVCAQKALIVKSKKTIGLEKGIVEGANKQQNWRAEVLVR